MPYQIGTGLLQGITLESDRDRVTRCVDVTKVRVAKLIR